jgi:hypothetical protein
MEIIKEERLAFGYEELKVIAKLQKIYFPTDAQI